MTKIESYFLPIRRCKSFTFAFLSFIFFSLLLSFGYFFLLIHDICPLHKFPHSVFQSKPYSGVLLPFLSCILKTDSSLLPHYSPMCSSTFTSQMNIFQRKAELLFSELKESTWRSIFICGKILLLSTLKSIVMRFSKDKENINVNLHNSFYFFDFNSFLRNILFLKSGFKHLGYHNSLWVFVYPIKIVP